MTILYETMQTIGGASETIPPLPVVHPMPGIFGSRSCGDACRAVFFCSVSGIYRMWQAASARVASGVEFDVRIDVPFDVPFDVPLDVQ